MSNIRASVAMATYNGEKYLKDQIDSILVNLGSSDELVISDDGSKDKTRNIIEKYTKLDARVRFVEGKGQGVKQNFANALNHCRGQYLFLCDQDDIWFNNKIDKIIPLLKKHDCVVHDCVVTATDTNRIIYPSFMAYKKSGSGIIKNIIQNTYIGCCIAITQKLWEKAQPIPEKIEMHDQWIGLLNDIYFKNTFFLHEPLIYYRRHENNVSSFKHYSLAKMILNRVILCQELHKKVRTNI